MVHFSVQWMNRAWRWQKSVDALEEQEMLLLHSEAQCGRQSGRVFYVLLC